MKDYEAKLQKCLDVLISKLKTIRTGRPTADILTGITALYYNTPTPLNQLGSITAENSRLSITVFDASAVQAVETAIAQSDLNANPQVDGTTISIVMPPLTAERRQALGKQVSQHGEASRIAMRNVRRSAIEALKQDDSLSLDARSGQEAKLQKLLQNYTKKLDAIITDKLAAIAAV